MTAPAAPPPESPFPGIDPYAFSDRAVFFGRGAEVRALMHLVEVYRGVLLYGDSGAGKSSLINAGLLPRAIDEGFRPTRIRVQSRPGQEFVVGTEEAKPSRALSAKEFVAEVGSLAASTRPLLVFDQFEEWVTHFEGPDAGRQLSACQDRIRDTIVDLLRDTRLPAKILLTFREDYLAKMAPILERVSRLSDQYFRLEPLRGEQVECVIRGPFEAYPTRFKPELSPSLARVIVEQLASRGDGGGIRLTEVQIVCRHLFESARLEAATSTPRAPEDIFDAVGGVAGILEHYLEDALRSMLEARREPAVALLSRMVTAAGTRKVVAEEDLVEAVAREDSLPEVLVKETIASLEQEAKLIHLERRRDITYYEIASESLVGWIRRKAQQREQSRWQRAAYSQWLVARPWAEILWLHTGKVQPLRGPLFLAGRWWDDERDLPRAVSRIHMLLLRDQLIDVRSKYGTTLNAEFVPYGAPTPLETGGIIVLSGTVPLIFRKIDYPEPDELDPERPPAGWSPEEPPRDTPPAPPTEAWGMLIDGAARRLTYLEAAEHSLRLSDAGEILVSPAAQDDAFAVLQPGEAYTSAESGVTKQWWWRSIDVEYRDRRVPLLEMEKQEGEDSPSVREHTLTNRADGRLAIVGDRHLTYRYRDRPFQIVPVIRPMPAKPDDEKEPA